LGNGSAGKTSLCSRFIEDGFQRVYKQTVGIDFLERALRVRDRLLNVQVWDIGGQSIGSQMLAQYIGGADIIFVCYDVTDAQSFADAEDWLALARKHARASKVFLLGNKVDLDQQRRVTTGMHEQFVRKKDLAGGFFISARSGEGVLTAFYSAAAAWLGVTLSDTELELTRKVLAVTITPFSEEAVVPGAEDIERADREAEERKGEGACCCVVA
jgi:Ras-related protein Rab-28